MLIRRDQRFADVKTDMGGIGDQRVRGEAVICRGIWNDQGLARVEDGVRAKRHFPRGFGNRYADSGLEPLAVLIDQADEGDWYPCDMGGEPRDIVVSLFRLGVQYFVSAQRVQARLFVLGQAGIHDDYPLADLPPRPTRKL